MHETLAFSQALLTHTHTLSLFAHSSALPVVFHVMFSFVSQMVPWLYLQKKHSPEKRPTQKSRVAELIAESGPSLSPVGAQVERGVRLTETRTSQPTYICSFAHTHRHRHRHIDIHIQTPQRQRENVCVCAVGCVLCCSHGNALIDFKVRRKKGVVATKFSFAFSNKEVAFN